MDTVLCKWSLLTVILSMLIVQYLTEDVGKCEAPDHPDGRFSLTGENSKYVVLDRIYGRLKNYSEAKDVCMNVMLEMAEIQSHEDELHLSTVFKGWNWTEEEDPRWFWLGLTDYPKEGKWYESDRRTAIKYQSFNSSEPDNLDPKKNEANNVIFQYSFGYWFMTEYSESFKASVLCQFRKSTMCYRKSEQSIENRKIRDEMDFIGKTGKRKFYVAKRQKTWTDALAYCKTKEMTMLDLDFDSSQSEELYKVIINWEKTEELAYFTTSIWTSGKYTKSYKDEMFHWKSTGKIFRHTDTSIKWKWDDGEPNDSTGNYHYETCISLATLDPSKKAQNIFTLATSNCLIPRWVMCYKDHRIKPTKKPKTTTEAPNAKKSGKKSAPAKPKRK